MEEEGPASWSELILPKYLKNPTTLFGNITSFFMLILNTSGFYNLEQSGVETKLFSTPRNNTECSF